MKGGEEMRGRGGDEREGMFWHNLNECISVSLGLCASIGILLTFISAKVILKYN